MGAHRGHRSQRSPVTPAEASVALGLVRDFRRNLVRDSLSDEAEDHNPCFPALGGHVYANLEHAPATLIEDRLRASNGSERS
jgi:hypothetical protein